MRAWVLAGVLLVAVAGVYLLFVDGKQTDEVVEEDVPAAPDEEGAEKAPELMGAGEDRPHVPTEIRGRGSIQGTVRRQDDPVEASVELRHVAELDPANPFSGGFQLMIERMLDAGISAKEVIARTRSGADGKYRFGSLAPGMYEVRATAASGAVGFAAATLPAHGARVEASIQIPAGGERLAGRVVYADGKPFQGLVVVLGGEGFALIMGAGGELQPAWTDADGRFVFAGLAPGSVRVSAMVPGTLRVIDAPIVLPYAGEYVLTIDAAGVEANGRVISAATEEPIAGATVFAGGGDPESSFSIRTTTTDADGRFKMTVPPGRGGGMFVRATGYAPEAVNFRDGGTTDVVVAMRALARVSGRVLTKADGTPVAGVSVLAIPEERRGGPPTIASTRSDADGRYALTDVTPGTVKLVAIGAGWVSAGAAALSGRGQEGFNPHVVQVEPGGEQESDIEVTPAARATGRVTTAAGEPVAGCIVQPGSGGGLPGPAALLLGMGSTTGTAVTDADGRYVLDTLVPETEYALAATAPEQPEARSEKFKAVGGTTHEVDLRFEAARYLDLRVVDAGSGAPLSGAHVRVTPKEDGGDLREFFGGGGERTDKDGRARIGPLPPGALKVRVAADGFVEQDDVEIEEGSAGSDLTLTVKMVRGLVIAGRVVLPTGVPVQSVQVTVQTNWSGGGDRKWVYLRPPVAADGTFRVDTLPDDDTYEVRARARWDDQRYAAGAMVQGGDEEIVLELQRGEGSKGRKLTVRVVDAEGEPIPSARIQLYTYEGSRSSSSSSQRLSRGRATFDSVEEDRELWIEVWQVVGGGSGATIHGPLDARADEVEVRLAKALPIEGSVFDAGGKGVRGVRVVAQSVHPCAHSDIGEQHGIAFSDEKGRFRVKGLGDLDYRLSFQVPTEYAPVPAQEVHGGAKDVRVTLRAGVQATLTVVDHEGAPVAGARVNLETRSDLRESRPVRAHPISLPGGGRTDAAGRFTLRGIDPDAVLVLRVSPPENRPDLRPFQREGWTPLDETVTFERAYLIRGVVQDQDGKPIKECWVQYRPVGQEGWTGSEQTDAAGRFTLKALGAGAYHMNPFLPDMARPALPGDTPEAERWTTAQAGAKGVVLVVELGASLVVRVRDYKPTGGIAARIPFQMARANLRSQTDPPASVSSTIDGKGRARFRGLVAGTAYTLSILGLPGNQYVLARDLRPGKTEVVVEMQEGGGVRGRVVAPAGVTPSHAGVYVSSAEGMHTSTRTDPKTGQFAFEGLPEGAWHVHASAWVGGKRYQGTAQVSTGGEVEIVLKER